MNYFKLRTLVIMLIFFVLSVLITHLYTNMRYIHVISDTEEKEGNQNVPFKTFLQNQQSQEMINMFYNVSSAHGDVTNVVILPEKKVNQNSIVNVPKKDIPDIIPVSKTANNVLNNQEKKETGDNPLNITSPNKNIASSRSLSSTNPDCNRLWVKGKSNWFDKRFNSAISPVWSRDNIDQPSEVNNWWLKLQSSKNQDVKGVMESAFRFIPDIDVYKNRSVCRRCAVVGNSGNLRGSKYGKDIDAHDMVIRMNDAPVHLFEADVGAKETHRLMYPESYYSSLKSDVHFVLVSFKTLDVEWLVSALTTGKITKTWRPVKNLINANRSLIQIYNPTLMKQTHEVWNKKQGRYPSTGFLAIMFALHACDEVDVYGYGANSIGNWDHYWQNDKGRVNSAFRKTGVHNSSTESDLYKRLSKEGIITLHTGQQHR